jgi:hypothetical protein
MSRVFGLAATSLFVGLSAASSFALAMRFEWAVATQVFIILVIAALGEHRVSGEGYYRYTPVNGLFLGNVPLWIPFLWVFTCQAALGVALVLGFRGLAAAFCAGFAGLLVDLLLIEPLFSRGNYALWQWTNVSDGYFSFIPARLYRFAAPIGNYIVWFGFPFLMSLILGGLNLLRLLPVLA